MEEESKETKHDLRTCPLGVLKVVLNSKKKRKTGRVGPVKKDFGDFYRYLIFTSASRSHLEVTADPVYTRSSWCLHS